MDRKFKVIKLYQDDGQAPFQGSDFWVENFFSKSFSNLFSNRLRLVDSGYVNGGVDSLAATLYNTSTALNGRNTSLTLTKGAPEC